MYVLYQALPAINPAIAAPTRQHQLSFNIFLADRGLVLIVKFSITSYQIKIDTNIFQMELNKFPAHQRNGLLQYHRLDITVVCLSYPCELFVLFSDWIRELARVLREIFGFSSISILVPRVFVSYFQPIKFLRLDVKSVNRGLPVLDRPSGRGLWGRECGMKSLEGWVKSWPTPFCTPGWIEAL